MATYQFFYVDSADSDIVADLVSTTFDDAMAEAERYAPKREEIDLLEDGVTVAYRIEGCWEYA